MRVLLTLLLALVCVAQEQTALLTGTVADESNNRITPATVQIETSSGGTQTVHVDKRGVFEIQGLSPGTYHLQIDAPGFLRHQIRDIQIHPGEPRKLGVITLRIGHVPVCRDRHELCL